MNTSTAQPQKLTFISALRAWDFPRIDTLLATYTDVLFPFPQMTLNGFICDISQPVSANVFSLSRSGPSLAHLSSHSCQDNMVHRATEVSFHPQLFEMMH